MKLADYMQTHDLTPEQLRRMLGVKSRTTVLRYISGERIPAPAVMERIERVTEGVVTRKDFLDDGPPLCRQKVQDLTGDEHEVYPWTSVERNRIPFRNRNVLKPEADSSEGEWPSRPLQRAIDVLGRRVRVTKRGGFLLDGRIADARKVVATANEVLKERGEEPIPYPGVNPLW